MSGKIMKAVPNTVIVVVCGTFVADFYASWVYGPLANHLRRRGYEVRVLPIPKLGLGSMDEALEAMAVALLKEHPDSGTRFILVGHSQGGSHCVGLLRRLKGRVFKPVIPIAAPHHGTHLANLGLPLRFLPDSFRQMAAHSRYLHWLREAEEVVEELGDVEIINLMTVFDQLVWPFWASTLKGAENVVLAPSWTHPILKRLGIRRSNGIELVDGIAEHAFIVRHPAILEAIDRQLDKIEAAYWAQEERAAS